MAFGTQTRQIRFGGLEGSAPRDVVVLVALVFVTYSAQFFTSALGLLRLSSDVWERGMIWQVATYPFVGLANGGLAGRPVASIFILLEMFILYMFAVDVFRLLRRRRFWQTLIAATVGAALIALLVDATARLLIGTPLLASFSLMQGQRMLLAVIIAAFAVLRANATVMLFFVLPIKARWFLWIEIAFAFIGFLGTKDLAGFVGVCCAIGLTVWLVRHPTLAGGLRELRLRAEQRFLQRRLARTRKKSKLRVVRGDDSDRSGNGETNGKDLPPWIN